MKPLVKENPLESEHEAGTSKTLKSLWLPISTTPTQKSAQIVYGCAFLLGEHWDFSLVIFWNWQDGVSVSILSVEESGRYDGRSWYWWLQGRVWPEVLKSLSSGDQAVLLLLDTCSSPADHPEPDPGPVAQPGVLWRPRAHNSGCAAAAAHHWGHGHHLEAAPGPLSSSIQSKWTYVPKVSTLSEQSLCPVMANIVYWTGNEGSYWNQWTLPWFILRALHTQSQWALNAQPEEDRSLPPTWGWISLSDIWAVFSDELTLPTGPCSSCLPTGQHLHECLPDDADNLWDLDPVWHLECHW